MCCTLCIPTDPDWIDFYALTRNLALLSLNNDLKFLISKSYHSPKLGPTSSKIDIQTRTYLMKNFNRHTDRHFQSVTKAGLIWMQRIRVDLPTLARNILSSKQNVWILSESFFLFGLFVVLFQGVPAR